MGMKNLVIFYPSFESGGVEKIIENLISYFSTKNINIFLVTIKNKKLKKFNKIKNLKIISPKISSNFFFLPYRIFSMIRCMRSLIKLMKYLDKKNTIIHSMQSSYLPILISKMKKFKIVIRNSEDPIASTKFSENKVWSYSIFILRYFFYNFADLIITNSKGSSKSLKYFLIGKKKSKVKYIYNPYLTLRKIRDSQKKEKKENLIIGVGRLCKQKNFECLIFAFKKFLKKYDNFKLFIIGDGYQKNYLQKIIDNEKLNKKVFLKGYTNNLSKYYKQAKLFVLPSVYEGLGNVLIDAINYSVPCVATSCKSGPSEILCDGKGGELVPINNIDQLKNKMIKSIRDRKIIKKKLLFAKKHLNRFYHFKQAEKYYQALQSIL